MWRGFDWNNFQIVTDIFTKFIYLCWVFYEIITACRSSPAEVVSCKFLRNFQEHFFSRTPLDDCFSIWEIMRIWAVCWNNISLFFQTFSNWFILIRIYNKHTQRDWRFVMIWIFNNSYSIINFILKCIAFTYISSFAYFCVLMIITHCWEQLDKCFTSFSHFATGDSNNETNFRQKI